MDEKIIGKRIRQFRIQQRKTQQEISDICGFSKSLLSKIENGKVIPSLATLSKISGALQTNLSHLVSEGNNQNYQYDSAKNVKEQLIHMGNGYYIFPFASCLDEKKIQPFYYEVKKDGISTDTNDHAGEEFLYILEGECIIILGNEQHYLKTGDGFYFDSSYPHRTVPITDSVKIIDIFI